MGYTTEFTGAVKLSRKLTMAEAKDLLEINSSDEAEKTTGIEAYFQWVPAETLEHIVWDGNEKFYKCEEQLQWLCNWLKLHGIAADGELYWSGEERGDTGTLIVKANSVTAHPNKKPASGKSLRPLDLAGLGKLALDQITG